MTKLRRKERARRLAAAQGGRITYAQLDALGIAPSTIHVWTDEGLLVRELPRVYAFAGAPPIYEGGLWAAILYAGPGASLTGINGAHWRDLLTYPDERIEVSTPRDVPSQAKILVHRRRPRDRDLVKGLPITPIPQLMLDLAATGRERLVRRALASLDYQGILRPQDLLSACRPGKPGSALLKNAMKKHDPRLALVNGPLEEDYLVVVCEGLGVPKPDRVDAWIEEIECDAVYDAAKVIVQLDGKGNHSSARQKLIDHEHDMILRAHGWTVLRYSWALIHKHPREVARDILAALEARAAA